MTPELLVQANILHRQIRSFEQRHEELCRAFEPLVQDGIITKEEGAKCIEYIFSTRVDELQKLQKEFDAL